MKKRNFIFLLPVVLLTLTSCFGFSFDETSSDSYSQISSESTESIESDEEIVSETSSTSSSLDTSTSEDTTSSEDESILESSEQTSEESETSESNESEEEKAPLGPDDPLDVALENINPDGVFPDEKPYVEIVNHEKIYNLTKENINLLKKTLLNNLKNKKLSQYKEEYERYEYRIIPEDNEMLSEYLSTSSAYSLCGEYINREESYHKIRQKGQKSLNGSAKYNLNEYLTPINDGLSYLATSNIDYYYPNDSTLEPFKNNIKHLYTKEDLNPFFLDLVNKDIFSYPDADERREKAYNSPLYSISNYAKKEKDEGSYANIKVDGNNIYLNVYYTQTTSNGIYTYYETYHIINGVYTGYLVQQQGVNNEGKCIINSFRKVSLLYDDIISKPLPSDTTTFIDYTNLDIPHLRLLKDVLYHPFNPLYNNQEINLGLYETIETPYTFYEDIKKEHKASQKEVFGIGMQMTSHKVTSYSYIKEYTDTLVHQENYISESVLLTDKSGLEMNGYGLGLDSSLNLMNPQFQFDGTSYRETHTLDKDNKIIDFVGKKTGNFNLGSATPNYEEGKYHYSINSVNQEEQYSYLTHNMESLTLFNKTASIFNSLDTQFKDYNVEHPLIFAYRNNFDNTKIIQVRGSNTYTYVFRNGLIEKRMYMSHERSKRDTVVDGINCHVRELYSFIETYALHEELIVPDIVDETYNEMDETLYKKAVSSMYSRANY